MGSIFYSSKSSTNVLKVEPSVATTMLITDFMPKIVGHSYTSKLEDLMHEGDINVFNHTETWMLDFEQIMFSCQMYSKMFYTDDKILLVLYIKRLKAHNAILLDRNGFIQGMDAVSLRLLGLESNNRRYLSKLSVFFVLPILIPFFLEDIHKDKNFILKVF